ncbi:structural maintenance of chromosomes protein 5-like [Nicotiana tabacum]|uniref:Structural maintenance of chromosomes protein 5-like n=1 Tax=Nicotiana tabacum TaxID=4097 RepID=A0AC58S1E5_TOBAC
MVAYFFFIIFLRQRECLKVAELRKMFLFIEKLLGRASSIGAFIKRGEESGYIKISLRGETKEEQLTIRRKIDTRNKSEWIFNVSVGYCFARSYTNDVQKFSIWNISIR